MSRSSLIQLDRKRRDQSENQSRCWVQHIVEHPSCCCINPMKTLLLKIRKLVLLVWCSGSPLSIFQRQARLMPRNTLRGASRSPLRLPSPFNIDGTGTCISSSNTTPFFVTNTPYEIDIVSIPIIFYKFFNRPLSSCFPKWPLNANVQTVNSHVAAPCSRRH